MLVDIIMVLQMTFRGDHDIAHTVTLFHEKLYPHEPGIFWLSMIIDFND